MSTANWIYNFFKKKEKLILVTVSVSVRTGEKKDTA